MHLGVHSFGLRLEIAMIKLKLIEANVGSALGFVSVRVPVNVFVDHIVRHVSTGRAKVASRPQMAAPISFSYFWIFFLDSTRRATFRFFNILADANMGRNLNKNMDVVTRYYPVHNLDSHLFGNLSNNFTNALFQVVRQNFIVPLVVNTPVFQTGKL